MARHDTDECAVVLDYLQIVPASNDAGSKGVYDKVSFTCSELQRMARALRIPLVAISSESRSNYNKANMGVFKESGNIEYSADVAAVMRVNKDRTESLRNSGKEARAVDLVVVKNRNGENARIEFDFYEPYSLFVERNAERIDYHDGLGDGD